MSPTMLAHTVTNKRYQRPPHIAWLERHLLALAGREIRYLMVSMPPRHGKSELISKYFAAWYLMLFPHHRAILTSYEAGYAARWGEATRDIVESYGPRLAGVGVRDDHRSRDDWVTTAGGGMVSVGIGGPLMGRGGELIIVDDPHKNAEEALSPTMRAKVWDFWQGTLFNRREPGAVVVVIQTRWHQDDLIGRLKAESAEPWLELTLPALALQDDPLGRPEGQALWPSRYDEAALASIRAESGAYWWNALYQQNPVPVGKTLFRREWESGYASTPGEQIVILKPYNGAEPKLVSLNRCIRFGTMDLAVSTKQSADYTVLSAWALAPDGELIWLGMDRAKLEGPDQPAMMQRALTRYNLAFIGVEDAGYQLSLIQQASRLGIPVKRIRADKDKLARALTASAFQEQGKLFFPVKAPWMDTAREELYAFPSAPHDDIVDTIAYAAIYAGDRHMQGSA